MFTCFRYSKSRRYFIFVLFSLCTIQKADCNHCANKSFSARENDLNEFCKKTEYPITSTFRKSGFENTSFSSHFFENILSSRISNKCKDSLVIYFNGVIDLKSWALEMLDASGKFPSSFFGGTMTDYGSVDDCIKARAPSNAEWNDLFKGKFCMVSARHPLFQTPNHNPFIGKSYVEAFGIPSDWIRPTIENQMQLRFGLYLGICLPSTCTDEDLLNVINTLAEPLDLDVTLTDCQVEEPRMVSAAAKFTIIFLVALLFVCVSGTILDLYERQKNEEKLKRPDESLYRQLLKAFSLYTNVEELFTVSSRKASLDCIHGLRAILCLCIMWGHSIIFPTLWKELRFRNLHFGHEVVDKLMFLENNGTSIVECFFSISAFLLVYTSWKKLEQSEGHMNVLENIIQKYCRLTPPQIFVILLSFVLPIFSSGPVWNSSWEHQNENCYHNGWKNLLYIQNQDEVMDGCMVHTWYIGASMQLLIISLPLMIATYRYPKAGVTLGLSLYFGSVIYYYYHSIKFQFQFYSFNSVRYTHFMLEQTSKMYLPTSFHLSSNLVGMLSGWLYLKYGKRKLSKMWLIIGWSLGLLSLLLGGYAVYIPTKDIRIMAFYNTTRNSAMSFGTMWIIYACASGQGGVVDKVLSLKTLVPLSRISYSIFLVHPLYLIFRDASIAELIYMDKMSTGWEMPLYMLVSTFAGFFVYILVEEPFNKIYDLLKKKETNSTAPVNDTTKTGSCTVLNENGTKKL